MQSYCLSFELHELPPGLNKVLRLNRWDRAKLYDCIYSICNRFITDNRPSKPLTKFRLKFTRHTIKPLDLDGLVASFKPFLDSLEKFGVILHDGWDLVNFDNTKYLQLKVSKKIHQKIIIEVISD